MGLGGGERLVDQQMTCAECLGLEADEPAAAITVFSGLALCADHYRLILGLVREAQEAAEKQARLNALRP